MPERERDQEVGLCARCVFARVVGSDRGAEFYLCGRAETDSRFAKYPRLPVMECVGFEKDTEPHPSRKHRASGAPGKATPKAGRSR